MLRIKIPDETIVEVEFTPQTTVLQIKEEIHRKQSIEVSRMRLMLSGAELEDNFTIEYYDISSEQTLSLFLRAKDIEVNVILGESENMESIMPKTERMERMEPVQQNAAPALQRRNSAEMFQTALAAGVGIGLCLTCCFLLIGSALDIAALVIAYGSYECSDVSGVKGISCKKYLIVGGWFGIVHIIFIFLFMCKVMLVSMNELETNATNNEALKARIEAETTKSKRYYWLFYLFGLAWGIIGCIIYSNLDHHCKNTPMGKMVISFCFIKLSYLNIAEFLGQPGF